MVHRSRRLTLLATLALCSSCGSDSNSTDNADASSNSGLAGSSGASAQGGSSGSASSGSAGSGLGGSDSDGMVQVTTGLGGSSSGGSDSGGSSSTGSDAGIETPDAAPVVLDARPFFSFFTASQAGLFGLPAGEFSPAPDPAIGYGGDFGGLAGADEICTMLARQSNETDTKVWRAFLSTSGFNGGTAEDAIDRIGTGPWYDFNGRLMAENIAGLIPEGEDGRPRGANPQLAEMFTDENGDDIRPNPDIDNHDTLTGSNEDGRLFDDGEGGRIATCEDWTSATVRGLEGNFGGVGGQVPVGHAWPRNNNNGRHWMSDHTISGCEAGFDIDGGGGAAAGDFRVGAGGGYGAIYCFALGAVAPE